MGNLKLSNQERVGRKLRIIQSVNTKLFLNNQSMEKKHIEY